ncbi:MAG: hypothetical protein HY023_01005 [Chloroflexi bacterium]|nr:hypothetical protein [Chloroflexota bacterium]
MNPDLFIPIGLCGGAFALALIGLALRMMRQEREAEPKESPPTASQRPDVPLAEVQAATPPGVSVSRPAAPRPDGMTEVMRVLRHPQRSGVIVEINGRRYTRASEIKDRRQEVILLNAIAELQQFAEVGVAVPVVMETEAPAAALPDKPDSLQMPSMNPIKQMFILRDRELKKAREKDEGQPQTIVEQIEAILVKRLIGSPFEDRSIHMRPGLHGGAHIDVDGRAYESVEDVPDAEVKEFIKAAIREWEKTYDRLEKKGVGSRL